ncbi:MAG: adenosylcobinamide-GDP ribazoletransferase [Lachnospiraceae bacterium]|nr:adenosylcobinamide-GDP ribazoletransferase [Lachnospiraceae bacterium]
MKKIGNSFLVAFAMYSKIPVPTADWSKENMKYALCFFPWIGAVIGVIEYGWFSLAAYLQLDSVLRAAVMTLIPVIITGGIHLDGFLDTMDALSSWKEKEQRLSILKDPHAGAFAIISGCAYFTAYFGFASQITSQVLQIFCMGFVVSRGFSGLSLMYFKNANPKGSAAAFGTGAQKKAVTAVLALTVLAAYTAMLVVSPLAGGVGILASVLVVVFYYLKSKKYFGGITGDLAGYFLCLCELIVMIGAVIAGIGMEHLL